MIANLDVGGELKNMEMRLTDLFEQKNRNFFEVNIRESGTNVRCPSHRRKIYGGIQGKAEHKTEYRTNHNISQSFRKQGIPEDPTKTKGENLVPTKDQVTEKLSQTGVTPKALELKRLGKLNAEQKKPRTLLVTVSSELEARLTLAKRYEQREVL